MAQLILRRILGLPAVLMVVATAVFLAVRIVPGDPARIMAGPGATEEDVEHVRRALGLDLPMWKQYGRFLKRVLAGDLGRSVRSGRPVADEIARRIVFSLQLAIGAGAVAAALGVPLGLLAAVRHGSLLDIVVTVLAVTGVSMPIFLLGLLMMLVFAAQLGWLPSSGAGSVQHLILPALTVGLAECPVIARMTRSALLEVLREDYIRTARAKGVPERAVLRRHALRNAVIPLVTIFGLDFGRLLGGAVITETVFAWPGMGQLIVDAIKFRDYPVVEGTVLVFALAVVCVNLAVDIAVGYLDPRVRYARI
jgi:ABC-type dipeptide/oligopeptide/nickel transport system permease component